LPRISNPVPQTHLNPRFLVQRNNHPASNTTAAITHGPSLLDPELGLLVVPKPAVVVGTAAVAVVVSIVMHCPRTP
jgi:hypothetical protein